MIGGALKPFVVPKLNGEALDVEALLIDRQGSLWVGTGNQGLYRIHGTDVDHFGSVDGLSSDDMSRLFEDRDGNRATDVIQRLRSLFSMKGTAADSIADLVKMAGKLRLTRAFGVAASVA